MFSIFVMLGNQHYILMKVFSQSFQENVVVFKNNRTMIGCHLSSSRFRHNFL